MPRLASLLPLLPVPRLSSLSAQTRSLDKYRQAEDSDEETGDTDKLADLPPPRWAEGGGQEGDKAGVAEAVRELQHRGG